MSKFKRSSHKALIDELTENIGEHDAPLVPINRLLIIWLIAYSGIVILVMRWITPFRSNWLQELREPHFLIESLLGMGLCLCVTIAAFKSSIPGMSNRIRYLAVACGIAWLGAIAYPLLTDGIQQSMLGKRHECYYEALLYSVPAGLIMLWLMLRRYSTQPLQNALLASFSVTLVPAYLMQLACMHEAHHAMTHHLLPALIVGAGLSVLILLGRQLSNSRF